MTSSAKGIWCLVAIVLIAVSILLGSQKGLAKNNITATVKIVFIHFDEEFVTLRFNRKMVFQGILTTPDASSGLSDIVDFDIQVGRNEYVIKVDAETFYGEVLIPLDTKIIYIGRRELPDIMLSESEMLLLD